MQIAYTKQSVRAWRGLHLNAEIGFVPTMGALHQGHLSLIEEAKQKCEFVVVSIFVNPLQFNNPDDFAKYPSTLEADTLLLEAAGIDMLFAPNAEEMYGNAYTETGINFGSITEVMEGSSRPGHFNGVGVVVSKLFNLVQPTKAYFGLKDLQQVRVIQQLVTDLDFPIEIIPSPTLREPDGLALSSRNARLTTDQRVIAPYIFKALNNVVDELGEGVTNAKAISNATDYLNFNGITTIDYLEVVDSKTLQPVRNPKKNTELAVCIACFVGNTRLIDNLIFSLD